MRKERGAKHEETHFQNCTNHQQETLIFSQGSPFMKGNFEGGVRQPASQTLREAWRIPHRPKSLDIRAQPHTHCNHTRTVENEEQVYTSAGSWIPCPWEVASVWLRNANRIGMFIKCNQKWGFEISSEAASSQTKALVRSWPPLAAADLKTER